MRTKGRMLFREMFVMTMWTKGNGLLRRRKARTKTSQSIRAIDFLTFVSNMRARAIDFTRAPFTKTADPGVDAKRSSSLAALLFVFLRHHFDRFPDGRVRRV